jgi:hypothetical protein
MKGRHLTVLLVLYVSLDFADPLMPGAVRFIEGALDVVDAERARSKDSTVRLSLAPPPTRTEPVVTRPASVNPVAAGNRRPRWLAPVSRACPPACDPVPSLEDH